MSTTDSLPYFTRGVVVKGFGRGSKDLGIPTANFPDDIVEKLPTTITTGVYFGYATLEDYQQIYKMVMSIGWNPQYGNTKKSMETHIMHKFDQDFYGKQLKVAILGYIRPEMKFNSLDELIKAIRDDIQTADKKLDLPEYTKYKFHEFFTENH